MKELLLKHQFNFEVRDLLRGNTPLLTAAQYGNYDLEGFFEACGANPHATNKRGKSKWQYTVNRGDTERMAHALVHAEELRLPEDVRKLLDVSVQKVVEGGDRQLLTYLIDSSAKQQAAIQHAPQSLPLYDWPLKFKVQDKGKRLIPDFSSIEIADGFPGKDLLQELFSRFELLMDAKQFNELMRLQKQILELCPPAKSAVTPEQKTLRYICFLVEAAVDEARGREAVERKQESSFMDVYLRGHVECDQILNANPAGREYVTNWEKFTKFKVALRDVQSSRMPLALDSLVALLKLLSPQDRDYSILLKVYGNNFGPSTPAYFKNIVDGWLAPQVKKIQSSTRYIHGQIGGDLTLTLMPPTEPQPEHGAVVEPGCSAA